jgi:hypothetical protein
MRLLQTDDNGNLSLIEPYGEDIPPYAILSHTWRSDGEEVVYTGVMNGSDLQKPGYD